MLLIISIIMAIALHEFAHAYVADFQGDRLPRAMGRLSLNLARHLDPLGTICIILVGFGWGKPVEFRPSALRSRQFGPAMVAIAGPLMNLFLAFLGALGLNFSGVDDLTFHPSSLSQSLALFFILFSQINVLLAVFNLLPLPPLDGSRLLTIFLPPKRQNIIFFLDRYGFIILLALVFLGGFTLLSPVIDSVQEWLLDVAGVF